MPNEFLEQLSEARRVSTPLVAAITQDPLNTMDLIVRMLDVQRQAKKDGVMPCLVQWDIIRGLVGLDDGTKKGRSPQEITDLVLPNGPPQGQSVAVAQARLTTNPTDMLKIADRLPKSAVLFVLNAHRIIEDVSVAQGLWNLRDAFKQNERMCIMLAPAIKLPAQLVHDVLTLEEPLPNRDERLQLLEEELSFFDEYQKLAKQPKLVRPEPAVIDRALDVTGGLSAFAVDQAYAMNISSKGININGLWQRKVSFIENLPGVKVWNGGERFAQLPGQDNIQKFELGLLNGREPFRCVCIFDEAEKTAGQGLGDLSGVTQEMNGMVLANMQDMDIPGLILLGPGGSGKTVNLKALGNEAPGGKIIVLIVNLSAMKSGIVGSSVQNLTQFFRIVEAVSDGRPLFAFTANAFNFSPEFQRRCYYGKWFFDLPAQIEREAMWKVYIDKYKLDGKKLPADEGWTGAEIRACSLNAYKLDIPLLEAAEYIVPIAVSASGAIDELRRTADRSFISAAHPGPYIYEELSIPALKLKTSRQINGPTPANRAGDPNLS